MEPAEASSDRPLTPGEALEKLFMDNAANGRNAANGELVLAYLATNSSPYWEAAIWSRHTCSAPG